MTKGKHNKAKFSKSSNEFLILLFHSLFLFRYLLMNNKINVTACYDLICLLL